MFLLSCKSLFSTRRLHLVPVVELHKPRGGSSSTTAMEKTENQRPTPLELTSMVSVMKGLMIFQLIFIAALAFGCGNMHTRSESKIVPIITFKQVAGKWEGLSRRMPDMRAHAQLVVVINDRGHFNFISDQRSGLLLGTGTLTIMNGQATGTTSSGIGTLTLHEKGGASVLVLEAALNDGNHYYVEMTQMK
jgi:hypothetical protein